MMNGLLERRYAEFDSRPFDVGSGGKCVLELLHINCVVILILILLCGLFMLHILGLTQSSRVGSYGRFPGS